MAKSRQLHVAVVMVLGKNASDRRSEDYSCMVGPTKKNVVDRAMAALQKWETSDDEFVDKYHIVTGVLDSYVERIVQYNDQPLPGTAPKASKPKVKKRKR